jgi:hypothetical protein
MQKVNPNSSSIAFETGLATLELDTNEVLTLTLKPNKNMDEQLEQELNRLMCSETYRVPKLQLLDIRQSWNTTQSDIRLLMNQDALLIPYARAVVIPNEANPTSIHAILMLTKIVRYPIQFFTSKTLAYDWLMRFHKPLSFIRTH